MKLTGDMKMAVKWANDQHEDNVIISRDFLKPFSDKETEILLNELIKTHYVFKGQGRNGVIMVSHNCPYLHIFEKDGYYAGFHKRDNKIIMLGGNFEFLRGMQPKKHKNPIK